MRNFTLVCLLRCALLLGLLAVLFLQALYFSNYLNDPARLSLESPGQVMASAHFTYLSLSLETKRSQYLLQRVVLDLEGKRGRTLNESSSEIAADLYEYWRQRFTTW